MDLGNEFWNVQSAAGSKRPSPSPGAEERGNKKFRTEPHDAISDYQAVGDGMPFEWPGDRSIPTQDFPNNDWNFLDNLGDPFDTQLHEYSGNGLDNFPSSGPHVWPHEQMQWEPEMMVNDTYAYIPTTDQEQHIVTLEASEQFDHRLCQPLPDDHTWTMDLPYLSSDHLGLISGQTGVLEGKDAGAIQLDGTALSGAPDNQAKIPRSPEPPSVARTEEVCNDYDTCFGVVSHFASAT